MKKYADVSKVVYDPKGTDPFTFRWYDPDEVIAGKKMREHLKFALSYWHTIDAEGVDMFGSGTMDKSMGQTDPMAKFRAKADFAFELMEKLNIDYYCFHDVDIAPEGATLAESIANFRVMVDYLYELQKKTGKKCLWVTANNFGDKKFMAGAATSCCADVFAAAAAKVRACLDAAVKLGVLLPADRDRIVNVLEKLGFDLTPPVDVKRLLKEVGKDKKSEDGMLRIVLPVGIGDCEVRPMPIADFAALFA